MELHSLAQQVLNALIYYLAVLVLVRFAGKRLAGQMTTFDLVVLIGLVVAAQMQALQPGTANAVVFILSVLLIHRLVAWLCTRSKRIRRLLRGRPRALIRAGVVDQAALRDEGVSLDELMAGLRKLGYDSPAAVKLAMLEETGHISAIAADPASTS